MLLNPEVQAKAQEELDRVVGRGRLPDFADEENLPYIHAICLEVLRWHPVAPLGVPHGLMADDDYCGMQLPKGCTILPNIWYLRSLTILTNSRLSLSGQCYGIKKTLDPRTSRSLYPKDS